MQWGQLYGSAAALRLAQAAQELTVPLAVVAANARAASQLAEEMRFFAPADLAAVFFAPDFLGVAILWGAGAGVRRKGRRLRLRGRKRQTATTGNARCPRNSPSGSDKRARWRSFTAGG